MWLDFATREHDMQGLKRRRWAHLEPAAQCLVLCAVGNSVGNAVRACDDWARLGQQAPELLAAIAQNANATQPYRT